MSCGWTPGSGLGTPSLSPLAPQGPVAKLGQICKSTFLEKGRERRRVIKHGFDPLMEREKEVSWLGGRLQASSAVPGRWEVLATGLPQSPPTPSKGPSPWVPPASPGWEQRFISPLSEGSEQGVHIYNCVCPLAVVFRLGVYKESVLRSLAVDFPMPHCSLLHRLLLALYWCLVFQA